MMVRPGRQSLHQLRRQPDLRRVRLTICLAMYGGALGVAALLVSLLVQTAQRRFPEDPEHMTLLPSIFLSSGGVLTGALLAVLITYVVAQRTDSARHLVIWELLGFGYGVLLPFLTGMLLPLSTVFLNLSLGIVTAGEIFVQVVNSIFRAPAFAFSHGTLGLFTGMLAGFLFGTGAWLIDLTNASRNLNVSRYGPYGIALALSIAVVAIAAFGPPSFLAKLG